MVQLTILTPSYNRSREMGKLIESLKKQTNKNFQWLVIDDGSTDNTEKIFEGFNDQNTDFEVEYHKKTNGGKHTALNYAHPYIKGEWTCIVDSDDYLADNAVEEIVNAIKNYEHLNSICVISFLRGTNTTNPFNDNFPAEPTISNHIDFRINAKRGGDCCEVIRTNVLKEHPFPEYDGERFLGEGYLWNYTGFHYDTVYINKVIYICEYLEGGLTKSGRAMRIKCPYGGMANSNSFLEKSSTRKVKSSILHKEGMLFVCYGKFAGLSFFEIIERCRNRALAIIDYIPGVLLYHYWKNKYLK